MKTILLLVASNIFMTIAWYGNLKDPNLQLWKAILISWGIAFFAYCLMVPANLAGYISGSFNAFQLKIVQEAITLSVFTVFALLYLKEHCEPRYMLSFACVIGAVYFAFKKKRRSQRMLPGGKNHFYRSNVRKPFLGFATVVARLKNHFWGLLP